MKQENRMRTILLLATFAGAVSVPAYAASGALAPDGPGARAAAAGPAEQYKLSKREARAAYRDAVRSCGALAGRNKTACMEEAQRNFQGDLAYARQMLARARQLQPIPGPQAQYRNAKREAYAAFEEAARSCRGAVLENRVDCMRDARRRLHADLAYAERERETATSSGSGGGEVAGAER